jgi:hypothetical protein
LMFVVKLTLFGFCDIGIVVATENVFLDWIWRVTKGKKKKGAIQYL